MIPEEEINNYVLEIFFWKHLLLKIKFLFWGTVMCVCPTWIFIFDTDQAQIYSPCWGVRKYSRWQPAAGCLDEGEMKALDHPSLIPFTVCSSSTMPEMARVLLLYPYIYVLCILLRLLSAIMWGGPFRFWWDGPRSESRTYFGAGKCATHLATPHPIT